MTSQNVKPCVHRQQLQFLVQLRCSDNDIPYLVKALYEIVRLGAAVGPAASNFPFTSAINLINEANFIILSQSVSCLTGESFLWPTSHFVLVFPKVSVRLGSRLIGNLLSASLFQINLSFPGQWQC